MFSIWKIFFGGAIAIIGLNQAPTIFFAKVRIFEIWILTTSFIQNHEQ